MNRLSRRGSAAFVITAIDRALGPERRAAAVTMQPAVEQRRVGVGRESRVAVGRADADPSGSLFHQM